MDEELCVNQAKTIERIERHAYHIRDLDNQIRKNHGRTKTIKYMLEELKLLKNLIIGQGCEFYQPERNWCPILNETCDLINKPLCVIRINKLKEEEEQKEYLPKNSNFTKINREETTNNKRQKIHL